MLLKKLIRTAGRYRAQFISMIIMTALGIGMFLGFNMEWVSLENNMFRFLEETAFADYRIYSDTGFTQEDLEKILAIDGVENASRYLSVNADVVGTTNSLAVTVTENFDVSNFTLIEGEEYDASSEDGMWLFDKYAAKNDIALGDELEVKYESFTIKGVVKGFIESSEYLLCLQDETQMMPSYDKYGYVYISPTMLDQVISDAVQTEILDYVQKLLGKKYTEESGQRFVNQLFENYYDEAKTQIFAQMNILSGLGKSEFKEAVNEALGKTLVVVTKDETASYSEAEGEAEEGKTMGLLLPVLFLLISVLTMVTTMHRIASNEKTQIGTLKALGFKDYRILRHYSSYTLMIGLVGTLLGIAVGYLVGWYIMNPNGMMGTYLAMPYWDLFIPWWCWLVMVIVILLMVLIGRVSVKQMLKGTAADALRPYVPKISRQMLIERTKLWEKLPFGTKWNLRDIMRHKSRSVVTLIGVLGCMVLMVSALGMYETADAFVRINYTDNAKYASKIYVASSDDNETAEELIEEYQGDYSTSLSVQIHEETYTLDIYNLPQNLVCFIDENNHKIELPADGAFVCLRMQEEYGLKVGDELTFSLFGTDAEYTVKIAGFNRSMTKGITISEEYAKTLLYDDTALTDSEYYRIDSVYTMKEKNEIETDSRISSVQSKTDISASMDSFMEILYMSVAVLMLAAIVLGIVVLYNLGVMSYTERYREMATLKVVGFKDKKIKGLLIGQNLYITVVGVILGIFAGIGVINYIMKALAPEYEMKVVVGPLTVFVSIIVTFAVSVCVSLMVARRSKKVDMVVALKTPE